MKNLFFLAFFSFSAITSYTQVVTIQIFETSRLNGYQKFSSLAELIQNTEDEWDVKPNTYAYDIDFDANKCVIKDENGIKSGECNFIVLSKESDREFQIEFVANGPGAASGIIMTPTKSAYYIDDTMFYYCTIFKTSFIF